MLKKVYAAAVIALIGTMSITPLAYAAENMEVTIIGGPAEETSPVSLDDIQVDKEVTIDGYAILLPTEFQFSDRLGYYYLGNEWPETNNYYNSGNEADYALLRMDLTNLATKSRDFLANCEVKVVYDDKYEYAGWFYQSNYDNETSEYYTDLYGEDANKQNQRFAIDVGDNFAIEPMYRGHYIFGCTLPNTVVKGKAPLRMEIKLDGNEITYNIRK